MVTVNLINFFQLKSAIFFSRFRLQKALTDKTRNGKNANFNIFFLLTAQFLLTIYVSLKICNFSKQNHGQHRGIHGHNLIIFKQYFSRLKIKNNPSHPKLSDERLSSFASL